jgi:hypothetical protein
MPRKGKKVGGTRKRGFGRCGVKPKKEVIGCKEMNEAVSKALARLEGVSVEQLGKVNKAMIGATIYGKKVKRRTGEDV